MEKDTEFKTRIRKTAVENVFTRWQHSASKHSAIVLRREVISCGPDGLRPYGHVWLKSRNVRNEKNETKVNTVGFRASKCSNERGIPTVLYNNFKVTHTF